MACPVQALEGNQGVRDGVFGVSKAAGQTTAKNTRISAVLTSNGFHPISFPDGDVAIYDNPHARQPWTDLLPCMRRFVKHPPNRMDWTAGDIADLTALDVPDPARPAL